MNNTTMALVCIAFAACIACVVNISQTFQIDKLRNKTEQIETALKLHHIEIKETP